MGTPRTNEDRIQNMLLNIMIKQKCPTTASAGGSGFRNARTAENSLTSIMGGPYLFSLHTYGSSTTLHKDKNSSLKHQSCHTLFH
jgi:hypothetical protein